MAGDHPGAEKALESCGRFTVEVSTSPAKNGKKEDWDKWRPDFSKFDAVVSNYNGQDWPEEVRNSFTKYVAEGGGLVIVHAADNAFPTGRSTTR